MTRRRVGPRPPRGADDAGSASVLVAVWALALTVVASAAMVLTTVLATRATLASAVDLAALAGASATLMEPGEACPRAVATAAANGATVTQCRVAGTEVWVVARARAPAAVEWLAPGRATFLSAQAHAALAAEPP